MPRGRRKEVSIKVNDVHMIPVEEAIEEPEAIEELVKEIIEEPIVLEPFIQHIKLQMYVRTGVSLKEGYYKMTVINNGFGDVTELNTGKILYTNDSAEFTGELCLYSSSFPKVTVIHS